MDNLNQELYKELKRFVFGKVKNMQDAEDIVQDVFIKAQLKSTQLDDATKFTGWMYTITRNSIIDYYRQKKKWVEEQLPEGEEEYNSFNDCVFNCLKQLMHTLPSPYREALELTEIQHVPQKELAEKLGISYSGAKSRVQRARQMLKEKMNELYKIETDGYGNVLVCEDRVPCGCDSYEIVQELNLKN
jgi:RNA polymerase sigma-70 factor (ECF subfamily)